MQNTAAPDHFWAFRCRFAWQAQGIVHFVKNEQNVRILFQFQLQPPLHYTTLHYTTLHYTTLHPTTLQLQLQLDYTTLNYTTLRYIDYNCNYNYKCTTLHYTNYI